MTPHALGGALNPEAAKGYPVMSLGDEPSPPRALAPLGAGGDHCASADGTPMATSGSPVVPARKFKQSGKRRLRGDVPRIFHDHRSSKAQAFRRIFREIASAYVLDDASRTLAVDLALDTLDLRSARAEAERIEGRQRLTGELRKRLRQVQRRVLGLSRNVVALRKVLMATAERRTAPPASALSLLQASLTQEPPTP
jgi:hypothetical protein